MIRPAHPDELPLLASIEAAAAQKFRGTPMEFILSFPKKPLHAMRIPQAVRIWVACNVADVPIGFLEAETIENWLHILEISVLPGEQRKGHARALIDAAREEARRNNLESLSLTTDRELPWNGPAYKRMGFSELPPEQAPAWLQEILVHEFSLGFDPARRIAMVRHP